MSNDKPLDLTYEEPMFKDEPQQPAFQTEHQKLTLPETIQANEAIKLGLLKYSPGLPLVEWLNDYALNTKDGRPRLSYSLVDGDIPTITVTKAI